MFLSLKNKLMAVKHHLMEDDGVGVIEIILILVVLVALVVLFKGQLNTLLKNVFTSINKQASTIYT